MNEKIFELRPLKEAKVSEISEATAAAPVDDKERVNFHIGHPIQDHRLTAAFRQRVFQTESVSQVTDRDAFLNYLKESEVTDSVRERMLFVFDAIPLCNPYMPRGGYNWRAPGSLIEFLHRWFEQEQLEPVSYDLGKESGQKELMLGSGGLIENLRVLFFTLNRYLEIAPAQLLLYRVDLPGHLYDFERLKIASLPEGEDEALSRIENLLNENREKPAFLILGAIPSEKFRRQLRHLVIDQALFVIEANDAPNQLSLAREALLERRVLRFLSPAAVNPDLNNVSVVIVAGPADYIQHLETVHFELKGTPSAPEAALLYFLLRTGVFSAKNDFEEISAENRLNANVPHWMERAENRIEEKADGISLLLQKVHERQNAYIEHFQKVAQKTLLRSFAPLKPSVILDDCFASFTSDQVIDQFFDNLHNAEWIAGLEDSFLNVFVNVHPEYDRNQCFAVSGSSRTALGLLGFHGKIKKVVSPDLSWTYEHCFPEVEVLPINPLENFTARRVIDYLEGLISRDGAWLSEGAIILNNPHNATGAILPEDQLSEILIWAFKNGFYVIDDLSYQNVGPWEERRTVLTLKQLTNQLIKNGYVIGEDARRLITVHSLSKTDSFAGARLTVIEIPDAEIAAAFQKQLATVKKHSLPLLIAYLFYRNGQEAVEEYYAFRNQLFAERMTLLKKAEEDLPPERNPFGIEIKAPQGSMYPLMFIRQLPSGISLDALSSSLANQGIGLVPLSTFARTENGYQTARPAFRLTLGGKISGEPLYYQMRRVLIDLNRLIAQEASSFQKQRLKIKKKSLPGITVKDDAWNRIGVRIRRSAQESLEKKLSRKNAPLKSDCQAEFFDEFLSSRLKVLEAQYRARFDLWQELKNMSGESRRRELEQILEKEFYKDDLAIRRQKFRKRLIDRTVHPTQMYSLKVDLAGQALIEKILLSQPVSPAEITEFSEALISEFLGTSVPINSIQEADELILDLNSFIEAEEIARRSGNEDLQTFLSFWGDWDGSTRPSGQGHRLVGAVVIENVARLAKILSLLLSLQPDLKIDSALLEDLQQFPQRRERFWNLLNKITWLTNQLEKRYRSLLPANILPSGWRKAGMKLRLVRDPLTVMWEHNDRLERKMLQLRNQRRQGLEYYFVLNKKLRKALHASIPLILEHLDHPEMLFRAGFYRDLLKRFVLTPRIHQNMITSVDPFAIDTTVFNLVEINELGGVVGNAGLILALQVSMTSKVEALIQLDQKLRAQREAVMRENPTADLPDIWVIPLFEDYDVVKRIESYLDDLWNYTRSHRSTMQATEERFSQMICEIFIAGSDLSQQVSQPMAAQLYKETKFKVVRWLAKKGLLERVRLKLGSGEPMQRQGGFYDETGSQPAFILNPQNKKRIARELSPASAKSTEFAITPLRGVMSSGDLRTFQSTIAEKLRMISPVERANFLYHFMQLQTYHNKELIRAGEPLIQTRLRYHERGEKELKQLTMGWHDPLYNKFLNEVLENFRQIVYGRDEDVVGIHVVSYFVSRMVPAFRDRPTIRPGGASNPEAGQRIIERLSRVLPLSKHGTLLRAIGHNRAQTMIMGINQLTTGLFRALKEFSNAQHGVMSPQLLVQERILPYLPAYEILHTLRVYQDVDLEIFGRLEKLFPPGNSAISALHEDTELMKEFIPLFQIELLKRHGLPVADFFENNCFKQNLLPTLRPDLAVLMQKNLFNVETDLLLEQIEGPVAEDWKKQVKELLQIPLKVRRWRNEIWRLIEKKVASQVESFVQLGQAIDVLLKSRNINGSSLDQSFTQFQRTVSQLSTGLQGIVDDNLKQFLLAALQYLSSAPQGVTELPVNVMRALRDVERIIKIEQQPLSDAEQRQLRFYILQIARMTGENG
ncbi:MAG: pyridoxal phosphate-dependent aminotransferase [Calditrichaeota bacterium]|nr:pyridoxal phosphate-dependent aminotransferase [Calditrichota bacterium]